MLKLASALGLVTIISACIYTNHTLALTVLAGVVVSVEAVWAVYYWWRKGVLCKQDLSPPEFLNKKVFAERIANETNYETYYSGWFGNVPYSQICRDNIVDLVGGNFYHKPRGQLDVTERQEIEDMLDAAEMKGEFKFKPGYNPNIEPLVPALDPLIVWHQPFFVFLCALGLHTLASFLMQQRGFTLKHVSVNAHALQYWHLPASTATNHTRTRSQPPIVFCHGIGVGLLPYLGLLRDLAANHSASRDIVVIRMPHVALAAVETVVSMDEKTDAIMQIIKQIGSDRAFFVGHSYGTFVLSRICKRFPDIVEGCVFVDPVCFCLYLPTTLYSFLYAVPARVADWPRFAFISRNLYLNNVLKRNFWWYQHVVWDDELPANMSVCLSEDDDIVNIKEVERWLRKYNTPSDRVQVLSGTHASWLASPTRTAKIVDTINVAIRRVGVTDASDSEWDVPDIATVQVVPAANMILSEEPKYGILPTKRKERSPVDFLPPAPRRQPCVSVNV